MYTYRTLNRNQVTLIGVVVAVVILLTRLVRGGIHSTGEEQYWHLYIASQFANGFPELITSTLIDIPYVPNSYHLLLSFFQASPLWFLIVIGGVSASLSVYLFMHMLQSMRVQHVPLAGLLFILSPVYIQMVLFPTPYTFGVFCILGFYYLYSRKNTLLSGVGLLLSVFIVFLGVAPSIILFILIVILHKTKLINISKLVLGLILTAVITLLHFLPPFIISGFMTATCKQTAGFIIDLGASTGFSIFTIFLSTLGLYLIWRHKRRLWLYLMLFVLLLVLAIFVPATILYLHAVTAVFSAFFIAFLMERKWELTDIKMITILLIFCGLLFSTLSYLNDNLTSGPTEAFIDGIATLHGSEVILSDQAYGPWITYYTGSKTVTDRYGCRLPAYQSVAADVEEVYSLRSIVKVRDILKEYRIEHIVVDERMKNGGIWNEDDEGLLFLLENKETFSLHYDVEGVMIYNVTLT